MKRDWKFLLGIGTGVFLGACYAANLKTDGTAYKMPERKITPYETIERLVENHSRRNLSFFERRYFFDQGDASEMVLCFPEKGKETEKDYLLFIVKGENGIEERARQESPCAECHPRYKMRLPLGPYDRVETG